MPLDQFSLFVAIGFSGASLGFTLFLMWSVGRSENHLLIWSAALGSLVAGVVAFIGVIDKYDSRLLLASFVLLIPGFAFLYAGSARFCSRRSNWIVACAVTTGAVVATSAAFVSGYSGTGTIIANVAIGLLLALAGHQYWTARAEFPLLMAANAALYGLAAVSFVACGYALLAEGQFILDARPANWAEDINSIMVIVGLTGIGTLSLTLHQARIASRHRSEARLDALTGLLNRRALFDGPAVPLPIGNAVVVMDVDHFKRINDRFGHDSGDRTLKAFASVILAHVRPGDLAARIGGEEFCIVLSGGGARASMTIAESIRVQIEASAVATPSGPLRMTVSAGIAHANGLDTLQSLLILADEALYEAKASGRNRVRVAGQAGASDPNKVGAAATIAAPPPGEEFPDSVVMAVRGRSPDASGRVVDLTGHRVATAAAPRKLSTTARGGAGDY